MVETMTEDEERTVEGAPEIPSVRFRSYGGEQDLPAFVAVIRDCREEDRTDWLPALEEITRSYQYLVNSDPYKDVLVVELAGRVIGYGRVSWAQEVDGLRRYAHFANLLPAWRGSGLRRAMLRWNEQRLREIDAELRLTPDARCTARTFEAGSSAYETDWARLLEAEGYRPARLGYAMVRSLDEPIPDLAVPAGLELRPAQPEHLRAIWEAMCEAFRDHMGYSEDDWSDERFEVYRGDNLDQHALWQVAWHDDQVAGVVHVFIDEDENDALRRRRGYTESICVRLPWRRQGLAKALIARSLRALKEAGMDHAALGVDDDNPNGAVKLYSSMGYRVTREYTTYRKPMADGS